MYSGLALLYLLFLRKQFFSELDGLLLISARSSLHLFAIIFLLLFEFRLGSGSISLSLTYYLVVGINRGSAFILSQGFRMLNDYTLYAGYSFTLSLLFSIFELIPATLLLCIWCFLYPDAVLPTVLSLVVMFLWFRSLGFLSKALGVRRKVSKQYIALILGAAIPAQLFLTTMDSFSGPMRLWPLGAFVSVSIIVALLFFFRSPMGTSLNLEKGGDLEEPREYGLVYCLLRPRYVNDKMDFCDYKRELMEYLDNRITGFTFLKTRYIRYHLRKKWRSLEP